MSDEIKNSKSDELNEKYASFFLKKYSTNSNADKLAQKFKDSSDLCAKLKAKNITEITYKKAHKMVSGAFFAVPAIAAYAALAASAVTLPDGTSNSILSAMPTLSNVAAITGGAVASKIMKTSHFAENCDIKVSKIISHHWEKQFIKETQRKNAINTRLDELGFNDDNNPDSTDNLEEIKNNEETSLNDGAETQN